MEMVRKSSMVVSIRRVGTVLCILILGVVLAYALWRPGLDITDGRDDRGSNAVWLAHGWLGADEWFTENNKTNEFEKYRKPVNIEALAEKLRRNGIKDVFPHLCPAEPTGELPGVESEQVERFLNVFHDFRVLPWIGGANGYGVRAKDAKWRATFVASVHTLFENHFRFAGVQLNVEPLPNGDQDFLELLEAVRDTLPKGKLLSVAAYPPPTWWHPFPEVHWDEAYYRAVARRCDQLAVMMYDAGQKIPKTYQNLMANWTVEVLEWSEGKAVLLGIPTYDDDGVGYHDARVENLKNALAGIHRGLSKGSTGYQGVAIYCDWETSESEWDFFREHFVKR
jgi:hypothetical protein